MVSITAVGRPLLPGYRGRGMYSRWLGGQPSSGLSPLFLQDPQRGALMKIARVKQDGDIQEVLEEGTGEINSRAADET